MPFPHTLDPPRPAAGLIVLASDETLEGEAGPLLTSQLPLFHSRIACVPDVSPASLATMEAGLTAAAGLLPAGCSVIGYGCTSAACIIGPDATARLIRHARPAARITEPLTSVIAALRSCGSRTVAMVTPYVSEVNAPMVTHLARVGITVSRLVSFELADDRLVCRISPGDILAAIREASREPCEAVFVSCTNLRTFDIIPVAERELGRPVLSSNQALVWHMLGLAEIAPDTLSGAPGALFRRRLPPQDSRLS